MKNLLIALFLTGCTTAPAEMQECEHQEWPRFDGATYGDGYEFEVWTREDGSRYLKRGQRIMDLPNRSDQTRAQRDCCISAKLHNMKNDTLKHHLSSALDILWERHGNGYGTKFEKLIAEIQTELDRMDLADTIATEEYLNEGPR